MAAGCHEVSDSQVRRPGWSPLNRRPLTSHRLPRGPNLFCRFLSPRSPERSTYVCPMDEYIYRKTIIARIIAATPTATLIACRTLITGALVRRANDTLGCELAQAVHWPRSTSGS